MTSIAPLASAADKFIAEARVLFKENEPDALSSHLRTASKAIKEYLRRTQPFDRDLENKFHEAMLKPIGQERRWSCHYTGRFAFVLSEHQLNQPLANIIKVLCDRQLTLGDARELRERLGRQRLASPYLDEIDYEKRYVSFILWALVPRDNREPTFTLVRSKITQYRQEGRGASVEALEYLDCELRKEHARAKQIEFNWLIALENRYSRSNY